MTSRGYAVLLHRCDRTFSELRNRVGPYKSNLACDTHWGTWVPRRYPSNGSSSDGSSSSGSGSNNSVIIVLVVVKYNGINSV